MLNAINTQGQLSLPVYYTAVREKLVTCLDVPSGDSKDAWVASGAAFILE